MKNIGAFSIAATEGANAGILVTSGPDKGKPQEPEHSDPQGSGGTAFPRLWRSA